MASGAGAQSLHHSPAAPPLISGAWSFQATYGANAAPAIAPANWTCGAGWDCSVPGTLNKNGDGVGTATPNPALTIVAGTVYKVTLTFSEVTVLGAIFSLGGKAVGVANTAQSITAAGTYTYYVPAFNTANLIITPSPTGSRFKITAISVQALADATGDAVVDGDLTVRSAASFNGSAAIYNRNDGQGNYEKLALEWNNTYLIFDTSITNNVLERQHARLHLDERCRRGNVRNPRDLHRQHDGYSDDDGLHPDEPTLRGRHDPHLHSAVAAGPGGISRHAQPNHGAGSPAVPRGHGNRSGL
jgi:hypothetical protein